MRLPHRRLRPLVPEVLHYSMVQPRDRNVIHLSEHSALPGR